jgi:hypothetical protein
MFCATASQPRCLRVILSIELMQCPLLLPVCFSQVPQSGIARRIASSSGHSRTSSTNSQAGAGAGGTARGSEVGTTSCVFCGCWLPVWLCLDDHLNPACLSAVCPLNLLVCLVALRMTPHPLCALFCVVVHPDCSSVVCSAVVFWLHLKLH